MSAPSSPSSAERVTEPKQPDRTLGELFGDLGSELSALVRNELDLAKTEARHEVRRASQAGAAFATAAIAGLLTLLFLSSALAWLLDQWINRALSFLIVAVLWAVVAMIGVRAGRSAGPQHRAGAPDRQHTQGGCRMDQTTEGLKRDIETNRAAMSETLEAIGDRVSPGRVIERRRNRMVLWVQGAKDKVMGTAEDLTGRVSDTAHQLGDAPHAATDTVRSGVRGTPLVAGGIAFGIGVLLGSVLPASGTERRLGQQARQAIEPVEGELRDMGREIADHLREPVQDAVETVKESAQEKAQDLKASATQGAEEVQQRAGRTAN